LAADIGRWRIQTMQVRANLTVPVKQPKETGGVKRDDERPRHPAEVLAIVSNSLPGYRLRAVKSALWGGEVGDQSQAVRRQMLAEALRHLESALELMDAAAAPPEIGAQLDFTLHQLAREINSSEVGQVQSNLRSVASQ
jgi:hypothetical protein